MTIPSTAPNDEGRLAQVRNVIAVASAKGGVGKSTVSINLAMSLAAQGARVGLLDADIFGPSIPLMMDVREQPAIGAEGVMYPVYKDGIALMSIGFIADEDAPVVWRGPLLARALQQFLQQVEWGELDYLILDLPPGTGDVQLTLTQKLRMSGAIIVTTPQDIALSDVRKGADMFRKVKTPILGVVENMSGLFINGVIKDANGNEVNGGTITTDFGSDYQIQDSGEFELSLDLFKKGGGLAESKRLEIPLIGQIPISNDIVSATDNGEPLIRLNPEHKASKIYMSIVDKMVSILDET